MKKVVSLFAIIILGALTLLGQDAKVILDKAAQQGKAASTLQGSFKYILENKAAAIHEESIGKFALKGNKYFVDVLGAETYFDGEDLFSYIKESNEVSIQEPDEEDDGFISPSNMFTLYKKGFTYKYLREATERKAKVHVIQLFPEDESKPFSSVILKINKATNDIVSMETIGKSGDNVTILITSLKKNQPISDAKFTFDENTHADVEIIDMR